MAEKLRKAGLMRSVIGLSIGLLSLTALAGCTGGGGGGGSDTPPPPPPPPPPPASFTLSGQILADPTLAADSDIADPAAVPTDNGTFATAQTIANDAEVRGFVNCISRPSFSDPCVAGSDAQDVFVADLEAGQQAALQIADYSPQTPDLLDLDLYLFDENGDQVAASLAFSAEIEEITITETGRYFLVVDAFAGRSNYSLVLGRAPVTGPQNGIRLDTMDVRRVTQLSTMSEIAAKEVRPLLEIARAPRDEVDLGADRVQRLHIPIGMAEPPAEGPLASDFGARVLGRRALADDPRRRAKLGLLHTIKLANVRAGREVLTAYHLPRYHADPPPDALLQWNLPNIEWQEALTTVENQAPGIGRPLIAVLDSGVFSSHPKIAPVLTDPRDFVPSFIDGDGFDAEAEESVVPDDPNPDECFDFHGTHVSTIAAAPREGGFINGRTMAGALPFADLMMLKLGYNQDPDCRLIVGDIPSAIRYAAGLENGSGELPARRADVINMSFGGPQPDPATRAAIEEAVAAGVIVVASAGNDGEDNPQPSFPASFPDVIAVAATTIDNQRASYSSFYPQVEVAAPGGAGQFDLNGDGLGDAVVGGVGRLNGTSDGFEARYALYQGTSMASPHVAAGFALMKAIYPELTSDDAHRLLEEGLLTTDLGPLGRDEEFGFGLISFQKMVDAAIALRDDALDLPADFRLEPAAIDLGNVTIRSSFEIVRSGEPTFTIDEVVFTGTTLDDTQLLPPRAVDVDAEGFGRYEIEINRRAIEAGDYTAEVSITASNGETKILPVTFEIPETSLAASTAPARVILERSASPGNFTTVRSFVANSGAGETFNFANIGEGSYRIRVTTDMDGDGGICDQGELGGTVPGGPCDAEDVFVLPGGEASNLDAVLGRLPD